jgi:type VI secretion system protein ImpK
MNENDPFAEFEHDRTVIKPMVGRGGTKPTAPNAANSAPQTNASAQAPMHDAIGAPPTFVLGAGLGPLVQMACGLLSAAARLRQMPQHNSPQRLRDALVESVRQFESQARAKGLPNQHVIAARYVLCTFIDECASSTPWGGAGVWSTHSLLVHFHNESWGGEKVFQLMGKLVENVSVNRSLLELIYVTLALGFEGRYRVLSNGRVQLETLREQLNQKLRELGTNAQQELSPHWMGVQATGKRLRDGIPVWAVAAVAAFALALIFVMLRFATAIQSDPVFSALQSLDIKAQAAQPPPPPPAVAAKPRLSGFLKPEIGAGLVEVRDLVDRSIIIIRGDSFFESGSAEVTSKELLLLDRIATELARTPGQVLVEGHTDNQPIRSLRYPSNWHLSQERAMTVRKVLAGKVQPERIRSEGLADTQPVSDNSTPQGRAKNRRVEITLTLAPTE